MQHENTPQIAPPVRRRRSFFEKDRIWLNLVLLILTLLSVYAVGVTTWSLNYIFAETLAADVTPEFGMEIFKDPRVIGLGLTYVAALIGILLAHEMGHYLTCRFYGLNATLPFFIPLPLNIIGTMGAFIRIRSPIHRKNQLFDVGVAGPLAGFVLTVPAVAAGLALSKVVPALPVEGSIIFGEPLLFKIFGKLVMGNIPPEGYDIILHPIGFAGWVGALVTSMNLFPIGQLDGGHVLYAVFGPRARKVVPIVLAVFVLMGIFFFAGWFVWAALIAILGTKHPPVRDPYIPLDKRRKWIALLVIVVFILCFIPAPIQGASLLDLLGGSSPFFALP